MWYRKIFNYILYNFTDFNQKFNIFSATSSDKLGLFLTAASMTISLVVGCYCVTRIYDEATQHAACQRRRRRSSFNMEELRKFIPAGWYAFRNDPVNCTLMWFRRMKSKVASTADYLDQVTGFTSDPDCSQEIRRRGEFVYCN